MAIMHLGWQAVPKIGVPFAVQTVPIGKTPLYVFGPGGVMPTIVDGRYDWDVDAGDYKRREGFPQKMYIRFIGGEWVFVDQTGLNHYYKNTNGDGLNLPLNGWEEADAIGMVPFILSWVPQCGGPHVNISGAGASKANGFYRREVQPNGIVRYEKSNAQILNTTGTWMIKTDAFEYAYSATNIDTGTGIGSLPVIGWKPMQDGTWPAPIAWDLGLLLG